MSSHHEKLYSPCILTDKHHLMILTKSARGLQKAVRSEIFTRAGLGIHASRNWSLKPDFSRFKTIPQPPGYVVGTVNDAYQPPSPNSYHGGHHWTYERIVTVALVPLTMVPFAAGVSFPVVDAVFSALLLFHCHAGFESCIIDYIPKRVYGVWHTISKRLLDVGTAVGIYGIYLIETTENGIFELLKQLFQS